MATHTEKAVANEHDTSLSKEARLLLDDTERFVTIDGLSSEQKIAIAELLHSNMVSLEMSSDEDFYYSYDTEYEDAIAEIVQSNKWQKRSFTKEHLAANKLYAALLLNTLRQKDKKEKITPQSDISRKVYMNYFSRSPSVTSYVSGGLSGQIELLALADKSPTTRQLMYNMAGEIIYNYSFTDKGAGEFILNGWMNARTIEAQIGYIHVIENLGKDASTQGYAYDFVSGACDALVRISGDKDLPPFITIIAWSAACMIKDYAPIYLTDPFRLDKL